MARDATGARAVVANASADSLSLDLRALGFASATVTQQTAAPLSRPGAGATVASTSLRPGADGRTVRVGPHALVSVVAVP
jgi:hypothetical protein